MTSQTRLSDELIPMRFQTLMLVAIWRAVACGAIVLALSVFFAGPTGAQATTAELLEGLEVKEPLWLCGETVPLDHPQLVKRFELEMLLSLGNRPQVILWLKRSTRYFPYIEQALGETGLPDDLKYLAVAESALRLHAGSRKGAMGVWQLMPDTARKYGLTVNARIDERRNLHLSTPAAMAYLIDLHRRFGSWGLSLAAYNMGEGGLEAEILEQGINDFYRLYLPIETQRFIFRILAIKRILEAPQHYGFDLPDHAFYPPDLYSTVRIDAMVELPLRLIAQAAGTDFKTIKELNPELRGHYLSAGTRLLNLPDPEQVSFQARLASLVEADASIRSQRIYVVQKGDNLSTIAQKFDVPLAALLIWNRIGSHQVIHPGQRLVIYPGARERAEEWMDLDAEADG